MSKLQSQRSVALSA
jgi:hypothetical protein